MSYSFDFSPSHNTQLFAETGGKLKGYWPQMYSPVLKEKLHDATILTRLCNSSFKGKFKGKGDTVIIRKTPDITVSDYKDGDTVTYQNPESDSDKYTIDRAKYYAFQIRDIEKALSDIDNFVGTWTKEGGIALAEALELEFFQLAGTWAHEANCGNGAGYRSGIYTLGSDTKPLYVYRTPSEAAAATVDIAGSPKSSIVDAIAMAGGALAEQKGGKQARPWIVIPVAAAVRIQTSEFKAVQVDGGSKSMLRDGVEKIGNFAGFDVYQSNLLPIDSGTGDEEGTGAFTCIFGDTSAITYPDEISSSEMLRSETTFASLHRSLLVYDFFPLWKERIGKMVIKLG